MAKGVTSLHSPARTFSPHIGSCSVLCMFTYPTPCVPATRRSSSRVSCSSCKRSARRSYERTATTHCTCRWHCTTTSQVSSDPSERSSMENLPHRLTMSPFCMQTRARKYRHLSCMRYNVHSMVVVMVVLVVQWYRTYIQQPRTSLQSVKCPLYTHRKKP